MDAIDRWSDPKKQDQIIEENINRSSRDIVDVQIEGFTAEDFDTEEPFMLVLNNHGNDAVRFQILQNKIKHQAERCKIKTNERSDYNAMRKAVFAAHPELLPKKTVIDTMVAMGFSGIETMFGNSPIDYCGYIANDTGITGKTPDGRPVKVCAHPIVISKRLINMDDKERPRETLNVSFFQDGRWKTIPQIPCAEIMNAAKIVSALATYGVSVTSVTAANLVTFLDEFNTRNRNVIPTAIATGKIGWYNGFKEFVPYTDKVFYDGSIPGTRNMYLALQEKGSFADWMKTVAPVMDAADNRNIPNRIMMAGSFGSVLVRMLGKNCFWINLNSEDSGSGKTVSLMAAGSVWGNPFIGETGYVLSMSGTVNGLEERAHFCNNLPLLLDEIQTMQDCSDWTPLLYRLCQGRGKNRAGRGGGSQYDRCWRLIILSTGEMNIINDSAHEGEINRIVDLLVHGDLMDNPELVADALLSNYGFAGPLFIKEITEHETVDSIRVRFYELRSQFMENRRTRKQADAGAMIVLASEIADKYVFKAGTPLTIKDVEPYLATREQVDINRRAYEQFKQFIAENIEFFVAEDNPRPVKTWGKIMKNNHLRIMPSIFRTYFLDKYGFNYKSFTQWCIRHGIMDMQSRNRLAISTNLWNNDCNRPMDTLCLDFDLTKNPDKENQPNNTEKQKLALSAPEPEQQVMDIEGHEKNDFTEVNVEDDLPF